MSRRSVCVGGSLARRPLALPARSILIFPLFFARDWLRNELPRFHAAQATCARRVYVDRADGRDGDHRFSFRIPNSFTGSRLRAFTRRRNWAIKSRHGSSEVDRYCGADQNAPPRPIKQH